LIFPVIWNFWMMKGAKMKTYSSKLIDDLLESIDPVEQAKTDAKMLIAANIADALKEKGWRNKDLLRALNKENPSIITKWLSGTHNFTVDTLVELGHALGINLLELSEPEEKVVIYYKSVSQKALTSSYDVYLTDVSKIFEEKAPAYSVRSYQTSFGSPKLIPQA
jgi:transcriptional regulator with XRE-family HTH domain